MPSGHTHESSPEAPAVPLSHYLSPVATAPTLAPVEPQLPGAVWLQSPVPGLGAVLCMGTDVTLSQTNLQSKSQDVTQMEGTLADAIGLPDDPKPLAKTRTGPDAHVRGLDQPGSGLGSYQERGKPHSS